MLSEPHSQDYLSCDKRKKNVINQFLQKKALNKKVLLIKCHCNTVLDKSLYIIF